jgi:hypothetical protein
VLFLFCCPRIDRAGLGKARQKRRSGDGLLEGGGGGGGEGEEGDSHCLSSQGGGVTGDFTAEGKDRATRRDICRKAGLLQVYVCG